jgi:hypothetical protein
MTTQLSYVIGGDICIHQPGNTAFSDALVGDVAFDARAFRCFWEEFANPRELFDTTLDFLAIVCDW